MRSLKNLIGRKKPSINNGRIYNQINYDNINTNIITNNNINTNTITYGGIVFNNLPISPIGLTEGSVWRDGEGILRIV
jgi:hypothetical protein